ALADQHPFDDIESFGLALTDHFLENNPRVSSVRVELDEHLWEAIAAGGAPHPHAFRKAGAERRTAVVTRDRDHRETATLLAGLADLVVMKTAKSAFEGFPAAGT